MDEHLTRLILTDSQFTGVKGHHRHWGEEGGKKRREEGRRGGRREGEEEGGKERREEGRRGGRREGEEGGGKERREEGRRGGRREGEEGGRGVVLNYLCTAFGSHISITA